MKKTDVKYTKAQFLGSKTLGVQRDVIQAVLKDDETYTKEEAMKLIRGYLKKEV